MSAPRKLRFERAGVRLGGIDFGGDGPAVLLLHGLAGHAGEWNSTAAWLTDRFRVVALDARGHGDSERRPLDVSPAAQVADAAFVAEQLALERVVVVGQSLGGRTALLLAAERPALVRGLVLADASPAGGGDPSEVTERVGAWLESWPVPFGSFEAAVEFFGGPSRPAEAWAAGLEERDRGWWPRFDTHLLIRLLREAVSTPLWEEFERVRCPVLVVRAGNGVVPPSDAVEMAHLGRRVRVVELHGAEHDLHLDQPAGWRAALSEFLDELP